MGGASSGTANVAYFQGAGFSVTINGYADTEIRAGTPLRDGAVAAGRAKEAKS